MTNASKSSASPTPGEALQMVHSGEIKDSKTMIALLLAEDKILKL